LVHTFADLAVAPDISWTGECLCTNMTPGVNVIKL
jgi:hypothetical protein